jgi:hypothetical protein
MLYRLSYTAQASTYTLPNFVVVVVVVVVVVAVADDIKWWKILIKFHEAAYIAAQLNGVPHWILWVFNYRQGLIAFPEPFLKIRCFGLIAFSGCSEKSLSALSEKSVSEREARTHNVWYQL